MDAEELIRRWEKRQEELLGELPPRSLAEYRSLQQAIRLATSELRQPTRLPSASAASSSSSMPLVKLDDDDIAVGQTKRISLQERKKQLIEFLQRVGPSPRSTILRETGIPNGSLSNLLAMDEVFAKDDDGMWEVKK